MRSLPGLKSARVEPNAAELELLPDVKLAALIESLNENVELRKFALVEPSLESIFIQIVGDAGAARPAGEAA
jgi:ABC-type uncharacterized transport system ATPase subunit